MLKKREMLSENVVILIDICHKNKFSNSMFSKSSEYPCVQQVHHIFFNQANQTKQISSIFK